MTEHEHEWIDRTALGDRFQVATCACGEVRRTPFPDLCVRCGREKVEWPRFFSQEFYEANRCDSGQGHAYTDNAAAAALYK